MYGIMDEWIDFVLLSPVVLAFVFYGVDAWMMARRARGERGGRVEDKRWGDPS